MSDFDRHVERNLRGIELEKSGRVDEAILLYEANVRENCEGNHPYDRLAIIYRKRKQIDEEIRVLEKAIWVFENVVYQGRGDRPPKLARFKKRLEKAELLAEAIAKPDDSRFRPMCPYCETQLDRAPARKKKCPTCGNYIHVRTGQQIFPSIFLTKEDARIVDHLDRIRGFNVGDTEFIQEQEHLRRQFGKEPSPADTLWSLYNSLIRRLAQDKYVSAAYVYPQMALLLYEEGKPFFRVLQHAAETRLMDYQQSDLYHGSPFHPARVQIIAARDSCERCRELDGRILRIDEAQAQRPVPNKDCMYETVEGKPGWCRCTYRAIVEEG